MKYPLPDKLYDVLKWTGLVFLPAAAVLYGTIAPAWNLPCPDQVVLTLNAVGVFIGTLIGASHVLAERKEEEGEQNA